MKIVILVDVLEIEPGGESRKRVIEIGALAEGIMLSLLEVRVINPHRFAVAHREARVGAPDFAPEFVGHRKRDAALADERLGEKMGDFFLLEIGLCAGDFLAQFLKALEQSGGFRGCEFAGARRGCEDGQKNRLRSVFSFYFQIGT